MAVTSMTGFASVEGMAAGYSWWRQKVNSKALTSAFAYPWASTRLRQRRKGAVAFICGSLSINLVVKAWKSPPRKSTAKFLRSSLH